jgi:hypothetical protein
MGIFEPLLLQLLPLKKQTRPSNWTKRDIFNGILYQLKMVVIGKICLRIASLFNRLLARAFSGEQQECSSS